MHGEFLQGMTTKSLLNAVKNIPLLIFAISLGFLYLMVCLMDWIINRIQYYSKLNFNRAKNRFSENAHT